MKKIIFNFAIVLLFNLAFYNAAICSTQIDFSNQSSCQDDINAPGIPSQKADWHSALDDFQGNDNPGTVFEVSSPEYFISTENIHGTEVVVAVHSSFVGKNNIRGSSIPTTEEFASFVFGIFHNHWHVFGGFPFDRYTVKVKSLSDTPGFSLSRVGITLGAIENAPPGFPPHHYVNDILFDFLPHEMFHSWNGKIFMSEPNSLGNLFQLETWLVEGGTDYYGFKALGGVSSAKQYKNKIKGNFFDYRRAIGTPNDLSIEDLAQKIGAGPPQNDNTQTVLYSRGSLIAYLLDLELNKIGFSLDDMMQKLYEMGLENKKWKQSDLPVILKEITNNDFNDFFNKFLHTNKRLPVKNKFKFLKQYLCAEQIL